MSADRGAALIDAAVVTFNPDVAQLRANLARLRQCGLDVLVVDNASDSAEELRALAQELGCAWIGHERNLGIAAALNHAVSRARSRGTAWLWTFDQDTCIEPDARDALVQVLESEGRRGDVALVGMMFRDTRTGRDYEPPPQQAAHRDWYEVRGIITTGSAVNVRLHDVVGGFDEGLFIDCVDHDYCIRCRKAGLRILRVPASRARHTLGDLRAHRVLGLRLHSTNHPPLRRYYMARNTLRIAARHATVAPATVARLLAILASTVVTITLFECDRKHKLSSLWAGVLGFIRGEHGPAPERVLHICDAMKRPCNLR